MPLKHFLFRIYCLTAVFQKKKNEIIRSRVFFYFETFALFSWPIINRIIIMLSEIKSYSILSNHSSNQDDQPRYESLTSILPAKHYHSHFDRLWQLLYLLSLSSKVWYSILIQSTCSIIRNEKTASPFFSRAMLVYSTIIIKKGLPSYSPTDLESTANERPFDWFVRIFRLIDVHQACAQFVVHLVFFRLFVGHQMWVIPFKKMVIVGQSFGKK